jgi:hypothetical protein
MSKEMKIKMLEARKHLLNERDAVANMNIINKINRQIRKLMNQ